jgi:hypothetical protein
VTAVDLCPLDHAAAKQDEAVWQSLAYVGIQHVPADESGPAESLELRNCRCGSTLCKLVAP